MREVSRILVYALSVVLCCSCSSWWAQNKPQKPEEKKTPPPLHLGAVQQVYPGQKFALLRIIGPLPGPGTTLISHPADGSTSRIGNLMVAENSKPRNGMVVADIRSGNVVSGDRVFLYRNVAEPEQPGRGVTPPSLAETGAFSERQSSTLQTGTGNAPLPQAAPTQEPAMPTAPEPAKLPTGPDPNVAPDSMPAPTSAPSATPDYINDIPDDINGWN